jgi:quercetin dioxygenase-like cupin family protein
MGDVSHAVDLGRVGGGSGPRWGMESAELNATLLAWPPGHTIAQHSNDERDVLLIVLQGSACVAIDGIEHQLAAEHLLLIPRGSMRGITAGSDGARYLSIHRRRGPLVPSARSAH